MKKNKDLILPYEEICVGECFKYHDCMYMKCMSPHALDGDIHNVNLETGIIIQALDPDTKVTYLPVVTLNIIGD